MIVDKKLVFPLVCTPTLSSYSKDGVYFQEYLSACQIQAGRYADFTLKPWEELTGPGLTKARAFASAVTFEVEFNNTKFYVLGGYNNADRFLDSIEVYDKNTGTFDEVALKLPEAKSHFCTVLVEVM